MDESVLGELSEEEIQIIEERIKCTFITNVKDEPLEDGDTLEDGEIPQNVTEEAAAAAAVAIMETPAATLSWAERIEAEKSATAMAEDAPNAIKDGPNAQGNGQLVEPTNEADDMPPPPKKSKFKDTMAYKRPNGPKPQGYSVLAVHTGTAVRGPLSKDDWDKIWMAINRRIALEVIQPTWDPSSRIDWSTWTRQRGLAATTNEAMTNLVRHAVADTKIEDCSFYAWKSGGQVYPNLCTVMINPQTHIFCRR